MRFLEKLDDPRQVVEILRNYLVTPEKVLCAVAASNDYAQTMLELTSIPANAPDHKLDIAVCRTDLSQYDQLLRRNVV